MRLTAVPATKYTWETGRRLGDRFRGHLRSTRLPDTDLPVGRHFTSPRHSVGNKIMVVSVISSGCRSPTQRRSFKTRMIFRHRTLQPAGPNADFNFIRTSQSQRADVTLTFLFLISRACFIRARLKIQPFF